MFVVKCALVLFLVIAGSAIKFDDRDIVFHLYTRANPYVSEPLILSITSILTSGISLARRTIITIHSDGEGVAGNFNAFLVPEHLAAEDVNILAIDWRLGSDTYTQGLENAGQCGEAIAQFVNILINSFNYDVNMIRIVGVGLGGHITGIAARGINGVVPHIVALDPSLEGWKGNPDVLDADAARVVEVLHTTAGIMGYDDPLGDIDFYPNGGSAQNGCATDLRCSHVFSYIFYAESISKSVTVGSRFVGTKCDSYEDATLLRCSGERDAIFGGIEVKESESGIYTFITNYQLPFAQG